MTAKRKKAARRGGYSPSDSEGSTAFSAVAKSVFMALPLTVALGLLLLFLATALLLLTNDPDRYHTAAALVVLYVTAFGGGAIATRIHHRRACLLCGLAEGVLLLLLFALIALCLPDAWKHASTGARAIGLRAAMILASLVGALVAARQRKQRKRHRR